MKRMYASYSAYCNATNYNPKSGSRDPSNNTVGSVFAVHIAKLGLILSLNLVS